MLLIVCFCFFSSSNGPQKCSACFSWQHFLWILSKNVLVPKFEFSVCLFFFFFNGSDFKGLSKHLWVFLSCWLDSTSDLCTASLSAQVIIYDSYPKTFSGQFLSDSHRVCFHTVFNHLGQFSSFNNSSIHKKAVWIYIFNPFSTGKLPCLLS